MRTCDVPVGLFLIALHTLPHVRKRVSVVTRVTGIDKILFRYRIVGGPIEAHTAIPPTEFALSSLLIDPTGPHNAPYTHQPRQSDSAPLRKWRGVSEVTSGGPEGVEPVFGQGIFGFLQKGHAQRLVSARGKPCFCWHWRRFCIRGFVEASGKFGHA